MSKVVPRFIPALICWVIFIFVVFKIPYPESLTQANFTQIIAFFASLYLALILTFNTLLKNILSSSALSLGLIFLLILQALDSLNIVTAALTTVATYLLFSYFKKIKRKNLTKLPKIPKLRSL